MKKIAEYIVKSNLKDSNDIGFQNSKLFTVKDKGNGNYIISSYVNIYDNSGINVKSNYVVEVKVNNAYSIKHNGYGYTIIKCSIENDDK